MSIARQHQAVSTLKAFFEDLACGDGRNNRPGRLSIAATCHASPKPSRER
jgi:hypothetical protein